MMSTLLSRAIRMVFLGIAALGMTAAMAQESSVTLQHVEALDRELLSIVAYSDPEGEVSNGMDPPIEINNFPETEVGNGMDPPIEINNFPESEITNGMDPPK
jgi:hypothetical protein